MVADACISGKSFRTNMVCLIGVTPGRLTCGIMSESIMVASACLSVGGAPPGKKEKRMRESLQVVDGEAQMSVHATSEVGSDRACVGVELSV